MRVIPIQYDRDNATAVRQLSRPQNLESRVDFAQLFASLGYANRATGADVQPTVLDSVNLGNGLLCCRFCRLHSHDETAIDDLNRRFRESD